MKQIRIRKEKIPSYKRGGATRIVKAFHRYGLEITKEQAITLWEFYSEDYWAAGWVGMPTGDHVIVEVLRPYFTIEPERTKP